MICVSHESIPFFQTGAGNEPAPVVGLVFLAAGDAEGDAAIERNALQLDVEPAAVRVLPGGTDSGPDPLVPFAVTHLLGDVAR